MVSLNFNYQKAVELAVAQQFLLILPTVFLLDGGEMLRAALFAAAAHWVVILVVLLRRPKTPTKFDLGVIRYGFFPVAVCAGIIASLVQRLG